MVVECVVVVWVCRRDDSFRGFGNVIWAAFQPEMEAVKIKRGGPSMRDKTWGRGSRTVQGPILVFV